MEDKGRLYYLQLLNDYDKVCENVSRILGRDADADMYAKKVKERNIEIS